MNKWEVSYPSFKFFLFYRIKRGEEGGSRLSSRRENWITQGSQSQKFSGKTGEQKIQSPSPAAKLFCETDQINHREWRGATGQENRPLWYIGTSGEYDGLHH